MVFNNWQQIDRLTKTWQVANDGIEKFFTIILDLCLILDDNRKLLRYTTQNKLSNNQIFTARPKSIIKCKAFFLVQSSRKLIRAF